MSLSSRFAKAALVAALVLPLAATPSLAGNAEIAYLQSLVGDWQGKGQISGENDGPLTCRMTIKPAGAKLKFTGRCSGGGGSQSFAGIIQYDEGSGRFWSSSKDGSVAGKKNGDTIVFVTSASNTRGDLTSTMTVSPSAMRVQFNMVSTKGKESTGSVPFSKS